MKFLIGLTLLACAFGALPAHADSVNLSTAPYSYSYAYTFPAGSYYAPYYGSSLVETETWNASGVSIFEAWGGTTVGNLTHFSQTWSSISGFVGTFSNPTFNSATDVLTAAFSGQEWNGTAWVPFNGHLTEVFNNVNGYSGSYNYGGWQYSYTAGGVTSANLTSVPEPGGLMLMGT